MFMKWIILVLKKWLWIIGFLPLAADYISSYIPVTVIPPFITQFLKNGTTKEVSYFLLILGLIISTYLVYKDYDHKSILQIAELHAHINNYENHLPDYKIDVMKVQTKPCSKTGCHVTVKCTLQITSLNPWQGYFARVFAEPLSIVGLSNWDEINITDIQGVSIECPYNITNPEHILNIELKSKIDKKQTLIENEWTKDTLPITLVFGCFTQPIGDVEFKKIFPITLDLDSQYQLALQYQGRELEKVKLEDKT